MEIWCKRNEATSAPFLMRKKIDGDGDVGLALAGFEAFAYMPDNTEVEFIDIGESYVEYVLGYYAINIPINILDTKGRWIVIVIHEDSTSFAGQCTIQVTEHDPYNLSGVALNATVAKAEALAITDGKVNALIVGATVLSDILGGKWLIENNQLKFYKPDNTTLLMTFNLKNAAGVASMMDVFSRERV